MSSLCLVVRHAISFDACRDVTENLLAPIKLLADHLWLVHGCDRY